MKKYLYIILAIFTVLAVGCTQKDALDPVSVIVDSPLEMNEFDLWLEANFLKPYNIEFKYRYALNESDMGYYTVPAKYEASIIYAHLVKYLCIDTYDEVAGVDFTRAYFPKMFVFYGAWVYNSGGSYTRGSAEGGKKIILYGVNHVKDYVNETVDNLRTTYIPTIHHEFMHILNQVKDFPTEFSQITPGDYVTSSWSSSPYNSPSYYRPHGFISTYSQMSDREDMAEMLSQYVMYPQEWWDARMAESVTYKEDGSVDLDGASLVSAKLEIMRTYLKDSFGIDLDALRASVQRRLADIAEGKVNLEDLSVE